MSSILKTIREPKTKNPPQIKFDPKQIKFDLEINLAQEINMRRFENDVCQKIKRAEDNNYDVSSDEKE